VTRAQRRKVAIIIVLVVLLVLLSLYFLYFRATQKLSFDIAPTTTDAVQTPEYLYSFSGGEGVGRLQRPIGVFVDDGANEVYVVDSAGRRIHVFEEDGDPKRSFGASETVVPLYIARHPKNGNLYVSDRRARTIFIFTPAGKFVGQFDPKLPKDQLPTFETGGVQWAPVAIAFAPDGTMYVTEILNGHRLLIFDPAGKFVKSIGTAGTVLEAQEGPAVFQFPNGIAYHEGSVYITDSNNRRVQVFKEDGTFDRIVVTQGLPRGLDFLQAFPGDDEKSSSRYVVVDTLAHDGTIWSTKDAKLVSFGEQGVVEGQFLYPNSVSVMDKNNKMFISDTANGRVQVWGWPSQASPVPIPTVPQRWWLCLLPLLLLPLLLLLRRRRFFSTEEFVDEMVEFEQVYLMPARSRRWLVTPEAYENLSAVEQGDVRLADLLKPEEHSDSDARALQDKLEIEYEQAVILSNAKRAHVFCTTDVELRRLAKVLEIDVVNRVEFIERFERRRAADASSSGDATE